MTELGPLIRGLEVELILVQAGRGGGGGGRGKALLYSSKRAFYHVLWFSDRTGDWGWVGQSQE